ncbi:MAG: hypothetical protein ACI88A_004803 [Paraglaciecola sp.]|jgi:hypothetical protein
MPVDYSESANALVSDVLKGHKDRNNLAVEVENGSSVKWEVDYYVEHGSTSSFKGSSHIHAVDPSGKSVHPTTYEMGLVAEGAGCNIGIILKSKEKKEKFVIIVATPTNKENYSKVHHQTTKESSTKDYWEKADDTKKHFSGNGWASNTKEDIRIRVLITGASPASAFIEISDH